jgi:hypothetical protein
VRKEKLLLWKKEYTFKTYRDSEVANRDLTSISNKIRDYKVFSKDP